MAQVENILSDLNTLSDEIRGNVREGNMLLVDLAQSTPFKTRHPEPAWLHRLHSFYEAVALALEPHKPTKYLGDGIFAFFEDEEVDANDLLYRARDILCRIAALNKTDNFRGDHAIKVRIILSSGPVHLFRTNDPQGTAVDKLFRMEKLVPNEDIGMTEEFVQKAGLTKLTPVGKFSLKGLAAEGRHALFIDRVVGQSLSKEAAKIAGASESSELWWPKSIMDEPVYLVGGYIPPTAEPFSSVHMGDKDAFVQALVNLALAGDVQNIHTSNSANRPDEAVRGNVVCVGGPCHNSLTRRLMEDARLPLSFENLDDEDDETPLVWLSGNINFEKETDENGTLTKDWGLFARFSNPHNSDSLVIIACGIESPSVEGIVKVFSPRTNLHFRDLYNEILRKCKKDNSESTSLEFCCVVPFEIEPATRSAIPPSAQNQIRYVIPL